jgi:tol-pal system protein YbgF
VTRRGAAAGGLLLLLGAGGCATRADIVQRDRQLRQMILEDRRQLQQVERELERLRRAVEEGPRRGGAAANDRVADLERRLAELESRLGGPEGPAGSAQAPPEEPPAAGSAAPEQPAREARAVPPETRPPAPAPSAPPAVPAPAPEEADEWQREVAREQAAVGAMGNVPERQEFAGILDGLARKDCGRAIPQLNSFAANHKDSPLADDALYWAARCYQLRGDAKQAISKFYDVVMRYPKGDKTPAALWAQGNLFVQIGDTPDARLALSELVRKYPASEEAAKARQKLSELEH